MPKITPPKTDLGAEIRRLRDRILRFSQEQLGEKLHVKANVISRWETGVNLPPVQSLAQLATLAAKNKAEEQRLFGDLMRMASNPQAPSELEGDALEVEGEGLDHASREASHGATVEGQMAKAIVDYVADPALRLRLVLSLRDMAERSQGAAEDRPPDPRPT